MKMIVIVFASVVCVSVTSRAQAPVSQVNEARAASRNPRNLDAMEVLAQRRPGELPRVRFVWDTVEGATEYVLVGRWTTAPAWTVQSIERRVTPKVAAEWGRERIVYELPLSSGSHTWEVVSVFGTIATADFQRPTTKSFDIK